MVQIFLVAIIIIILIAVNHFSNYSDFENNLSSSRGFKKLILLPLLSLLTF
jgi:hypothetical protein